MDNVWHTLDLTLTLFNQAQDQKAFDLFKSHVAKQTTSQAGQNKNEDNEGGHEDQSTNLNRLAEKTRETAIAPFARNLHRIRVLKVRFTKHLDALFESVVGAKGSRQDNEGRDNIPTLRDLALQEVTVEFDDVQRPTHTRPGTTPLPPIESSARTIESLVPRQGAYPPVPAMLELIDMRPIHHILRHSPNLSGLHLNIEELTVRSQHEDYKRLLNALPASLESLSLIFQNYIYSYKNPVADDQTTHPWTPATTATANILTRLTTLTITGLRTEMPTLLGLLDRCPVLDELSVVCSWESMDDRSLAQVISTGSKSKGWKTLGFKDVAEIAGTWTVAAILEHAATLENLRLGGTKALSSKAIQKLLCSAPRLKRFDTITEVLVELEPYSLMASDIVDTSEDWVCLELESFKCYIGGIPRPDLQTKTNGRPLLGIFNNPDRYTTQQSRYIQRQVLAKLARLTKLREITLGQETVNFESRNHQASSDEQDMELDWYDRFAFQLGRQYQCLSMALEDGLDLLSDLKSLRRLHVKKMNLFMGSKEDKWIKANWPDFGKTFEDTFWTSRGHEVPIL